MIVTHADIRRFAEERVNLPPDTARRHGEQVDELRGRLARHVADNPGFGLVKMLDAGSAARGTALSSGDLDVAVYVEEGKLPDDEKRASEWMAERLRSAGVDPGGVTGGARRARIHFGATGLDADVVAVVDEGDDWGRLTDVDTGERPRTNIRLHSEFVRRRREKNPHFTQIARLVKWWAKCRREEGGGFRCKSFVLELLVAKMADSGSELSYYPRALEEFFSRIAKTGLREQVAFDGRPAGAAAGAPIEVLDPANPRNNVAGGYSEKDRDALVRAAEDAADAIREARYSTTRNRAVECWQAVLGPHFGG